MKVLIVGGGGREHALAWKAAQSVKVSRVYVAPGNAGTEREPGLENVPVAAEDLDALLEFAQAQSIDLTLVGPEVPLVQGIVDRFQAAGLRCFGPSRQAAQLEGSKAFCKEFLARHGIPTAYYQAFTEPESACAYVREHGTPIVIKADGLAAGKGVVIAQSESEAEAAIHDMLSGQGFGAAGQRIIIEEFLQGEEASFIVVASGQQALAMATSQDHKARDNGDRGPNTGGMGAYSPAPVVTAEIQQRVMAEVIQPTLDGMAADSMPYTGFLYAGLMIDAEGHAKVLEYNCRLGDPETQPILMRLQSDLIEVIDAALEQRLDSVEIQWDSRPALGVVLAAGGYPGSYHKGHVITGLNSEASADLKIFHAGTTTDDQGHVVTNGGRVLCACALGETVAEAQAAAYEQVNHIQWTDVYYRTDIGYRAVQRT